MEGKQSSSAKGFSSSTRSPGSAQLSWSKAISKPSRRSSFSSSNSKNRSMTTSYPTSVLTPKYCKAPMKSTPSSSTSWEAVWTIPKNSNCFIEAQKTTSALLSSITSATTYLTLSHSYAPSLARLSLVLRPIPGTPLTANMSRMLTKELFYFL